MNFNYCAFNIKFYCIRKAVKCEVHVEMIYTLQPVVDCVSRLYVQCVYRLSCTGYRRASFRVSGRAVDSAEYMYEGSLLLIQKPY